MGEADREWFNFDLGPIDFVGRRILMVSLQEGWRDSAGPGADGMLTPPLFLVSANLEQAAGAPATGRFVLRSVRALLAPPGGLGGLAVDWLLPDAGAFLLGEEIAPYA